MKIVPLYKHLGTSFKKEFRSQFKNNEYNFEDQTILFDEGILSKNNKNEIIDTFYDFVLTEPKFRIVSDRIFINNSNFWHLYSMFIENKIMFNKDQKTEVLNNSNLFSWLLYPSEFDYDKFELDWIKILNINSFYWEHLNSANKKITEKMKDMLIVQYDEKVSKMYWKLKTKESL